jgi:hypothetical protein
MITILNQTPKFLRVMLSRGKVLRLGPRKEGQISSQDAELDSVKKLVDDGAIKVMGEGPQAGSSSAANPAMRANVQGHIPRVTGGRRGDR